MKLAIIGMGIMGCKYAKMISEGYTQGIEVAAVTRITPERKAELKDIDEEAAFEKEYETYLRGKVNVTGSDLR